MTPHTKLFDPAKAYLIRPDGTWEQITPDNGKDFRLPQLYKLLACRTIEVIYPSPERIMILDEDGKRNEWPINHTATAMTRHLLAADDLIVGNVIICPNRMLT